MVLNMLVTPAKEFPNIISAVHYSLCPQKVLLDRLPLQHQMNINILKAGTMGLPSTKAAKGLRHVETCSSPFLLK